MEMGCGGGRYIGGVDGLAQHFGEPGTVLGPTQMHVTSRGVITQLSYSQKKKKNSAKFSFFLGKHNIYI
jgi:hypothetical protein